VVHQFGRGRPPADDSVIVNSEDGKPSNRWDLARNNTLAEKIRLKPPTTPRLTHPTIIASGPDGTVYAHQQTPPSTDGRSDASKGHRT